MTFRTINIYFKFSREQHKGVFALFGIIVVLQTLYLFGNFNALAKEFPEKQKWLSLQSQIDSMKMEEKKESPRIYLFNPNFITDYKGYKLGMSVQEIDRLLAFRKDNKYVNSAKEFQDVTTVSDSLLGAIAPNFKFPDWVNKKDSYKKDVRYGQKAFVQKAKIVPLTIKKATQEDLIKIYGIGEVISLRILRLKESLGGFVSMEQMKDVWGLSAEVIDKLNAHYRVFGFPDIKKIDINNASVKEISQFPYFRYALAKQIVTYRSMNGDFNNIEDLTKIKDFPVENVKIIELYLVFN